MQISILIPTYDRACVELIHVLGRQLLRHGSLACELLVAEDGSSDKLSMAANAQALGNYPFARHLIYGENVGRAQIRNRLAEVARGDWCIFLDSGAMIASDDWLGRYIEAIEIAGREGQGVVCGGLEARPGKDGKNLRYRYERSARKLQCVSFRRRHPYASFRTANFCVSRRVIQSIPFDHRFHDYGHEDVIFGKHLAQAHVSILHIDNPAIYVVYDTDSSFLQKTETANRVLRTYCDELRGYSGLITAEDWLRRIYLLGIFRRLSSPYLTAMRRHLLTGKASLLYYKVYRLCHYLSTENHAYIAGEKGP